MQVTGQDTPEEKGQSDIPVEEYFQPEYPYIVVYAPPPERKSASGIDLSAAESLDANLPINGTVVASSVHNSFEVGDQVLIRRYAGIRAEFNGEPNYFFLNTERGEVLGRFSG